MSSSAASYQWRVYGNEFYRQAGQASTLTTAADYLKKAVNAYEEAFKLATDNEERRFGLRNMGMAYLHLARNCNKRALAAVNEVQADGSTYYYSTNHRTDYHPSIMLYFYKEAINKFCQCVPLIDQSESEQPDKSTLAGGGDGATQRDTQSKFMDQFGDGATQRDTQSKFMDQLTSNLNDCAQEALSFLMNMDYFPTYKARIEQLEHLINALGDTFRDWTAVYQLEKAKTYHKWAITEMQRSKNYVTALHCLKECYSPLEIVRKLMPVVDIVDLTSDDYEYDLDGGAFGKFTELHCECLEDLIDSIRADTAVAEAMQLIQKGDKSLQFSILESEQLNVDGVHDAIDMYRAAIVTLHDSDGLDFILEAEAFSKMGQIYFNVLKNVTQGKIHCMTSVQLAGTVEHQNFAGKDWYDKAAAILKQIQDEQRKAEEDEVRKNREPFLKALEKELNELKLYKDKSAETMIAEFPKKFPPKHRPDSKLSDELTSMKFSSDTPRSDVKKALSKLILLYHPDHVDIKEHGGEYFVLCEEITKVITMKHEYFKF